MFDCFVPMVFVFFANNFSSSYYLSLFRSQHIFYLCHITTINRASLALCRAWGYVTAGIDVTISQQGSLNLERVNVMQLYLVLRSSYIQYLSTRVS